MKSLKLVAALRKEMKESHAALAVKISELAEVHVETQRRLQTLEMLQTNPDTVKEEEKENEEEPNGTMELGVSRMYCTSLGQFRSNTYILGCRSL